MWRFVVLAHLIRALPEMLNKEQPRELALWGRVDTLPESTPYGLPRIVTASRTERGSELARIRADSRTFMKR